MHVSTDLYKFILKCKSKFSWGNTLNAEIVQQDGKKLFQEIVQGFESDMRSKFQFTFFHIKCL